MVQSVVIKNLLHLDTLLLLKISMAKIMISGELKRHLNVPINWTTDVNAAAYGYYFDHGKDLESCSVLHFGDRCWWVGYPTWWCRWDELPRNGSYDC